MKTKRATAFTFVEVLLALAVVSLSLLSLLRLHVTGIKMAERIDMTTQAVFLAEEKMTETLASGYPQVGTCSGCVEKNARRLNWRTQVANTRPALPHNLRIEGLRELSVEVSWEQGGGLKTLKIATYIAERNKQ